MREEVLYQPIDREPVIQVGDRPETGLVGTRDIQHAQRELNINPTLYDGEISMVKSLDLVVPCLEIFPARMRWQQACLISESVRKITRGPLKVMAMICNAEGEMLWQRRSADIDDGMLWSFSASAYLSPGLSTSKCIDSCVMNELGVNRSDVTLKPKAIALFERSGVKVIYEGGISPEASLMPDPAQVSDLLWAPLDDPPSNLASDVEAIIECFRSAA